MRQKLHQLIPPEEQGGFIVRTMAETAGDADMLADIAYLRRLWDDIQVGQIIALRPASCIRT